MNTLGLVQSTKVNVFTNGVNCIQNSRHIIRLHFRILFWIALAIILDQIVLCQFLHLLCPRLYFFLTLHGDLFVYDVDN